MRTRILMLLMGAVLLFSGKAHAQWVVTDPGNFAGNIVNSVKERECKLNCVRLQ